jgi:lipoate-protein ligase A
MKSEGSVKIEGGKKVNVKLEFGSEIENAKIRGDFFLQPPEALEELEAMLEGVRTDEAKETIIQALETVDAELIGFSAEDIAEAVKQATEINWRIINEGSYSEEMHHAIDEVLAEKMAKGNMDPVIRFWYREKPAVPIGRFQAYEDEVEHEYVEDEGISVVRRNTGGGAMFAEPGNVITYSIYIPEHMVKDDIEASYQELDQFAVETLQNFGLDVQYAPLNDIEHEDGKIGGAAQLRKNGAVLHHTMISYDLNTDRMLKALRIGKDKVSDKAIESAEKRVAKISDYIDYQRQDIVNELINQFKSNFGGRKGELLEDELKRAEQLAESKFSRDEWNKKM